MFSHHELIDEENLDLEKLLDDIITGIINKLKKSLILIILTEIVDFLFVERLIKNILYFFNSFWFEFFKYCDGMAKTYAKYRSTFVAERS